MSEVQKNIETKVLHQFEKYASYIDENCHVGAILR